MKLYEPAPPARKDELANVQDGIAVIVDGDTCPIVVESGMYAYIKNNTHGLAEGLYKNISDSAFPTSGGTADGTVFEADSTGGLNALNASTIDITSQCNVNAGLNVHVYKSGKIIQITFACDSGIPSSGYGTIATLPNDSRPLGTVFAQLYNNTSTSIGVVRIGISVEAYNPTGSLYGNVIFLIA